MNPKPDVNKYDNSQNDQPHRQLDFIINTYEEKYDGCDDTYPAKEGIESPQYLFIEKRHFHSTSPQSTYDWRV